MTGVVVLAAALLAVGTALGLLRQRHRIRALEAERDQMYEAQRILQRAQERKDRRHLHLLVAVPLAWLVGRLSSSSAARLAAATTVSAMVTGASVMSPDNSYRHTPGISPPAGAETSIPHVAPDTLSYTYSPQSTTSSSVAVAPPAPATGPVAVPTPSNPASPSAEASAPATTTTSTTTTVPEITTTTVLIDGPVACLNPQGIPLPAEVCL